MMKKLNSFWAKVKIKDKIKLFTGSVFLTIIIAIAFDFVLIKLFVIDVNDIMDDNSKSGEIIAAIDRERDCFGAYINTDSDENKTELKESMEDTKKAIDALKLDYTHLGENRYAQLFSLKTCYDVYCEDRDEILAGGMDKKTYVAKLYSVYNMQDYLYSYSQKFVDMTLKESNGAYKEIIPRVYAVPIIAITLSLILFSAVFEISRMMYKSITEPVLMLANASRRIAANDFFIPDVHSDNKDELGELVAAFNKMKYATGEYIMALEKRREALDQLHAQEVQTLEVEKQLDAMNLELLKNQINPHFLFNTLNVIDGMANLEGAKTTEQMIKALSSIFRYNLKNQDIEVPLSKELKVASDYMYLQKMRFGDRVKYVEKCTLDAEKVLVPTFTLQPLIENSIIHGISPKVEGGYVFVDVLRQEDYLILSVTDTGKGIDKETLDKIRRSLEGQEIEDESMGIGMGNINGRIKAMYPDATMEIDSIDGEGTSIKITIPYRICDT
ncbi:MAG: sensor histidine kinase [Pseudobutyrivibrio sp.]|nr:sensor histidine kinase [Pseudobutyrivibrio sp.]